MPRAGSALVVGAGGSHGGNGSMSAGGGAPAGGMISWGAPGRRLVVLNCRTPVPLLARQVGVPVSRMGVQGRKVTCPSRYAAACWRGTPIWASMAAVMLACSAGVVRTSPWMPDMRLEQRRSARRLCLRGSTEKELEQSAWGEEERKKPARGLTEGHDDSIRC